jgi:hypothetical protein
LLLLGKGAPDPAASVGESEKHDQYDDDLEDGASLVILLLVWLATVLVLIGIGVRARLAREPRGREREIIWLFAVGLPLVSVSNLLAETDGGNGGRWRTRTSDLSGVNRTL